MSSSYPADQVYEESEGNSSYVPNDAFPELDWIPFSDGGWQALAMPGPDFWDVYNAGRRDLYNVGFSTHLIEEHGERRWYVRFNPARTTFGAVAAAVAAVRERYRVTQLSKSEQQLIAEEDDRKRRAQWEAGRPAREAAERERQVRAAADRLAWQTKAHDDAVGCLSRWGDFCHQRSRLEALAALPIDQIGHPQLHQINKIVTETEQKARARRLAVANDVDAGVDWSEGLIIAAAEHLTAVDSDHARVTNKRGWSRADSSVGHWIFGELSGGERELAIRAARRIVGKYQRQMIEAGILSEEIN